MNPSGLLVVYKPRGPTSHDVVGQARRVLGTRAVGHAGTLDPLASGVLVLLVGEATKLSPYLTLDEKAYRATISFGRSTTTLDAEGDVVEEREVPPELLDGSALDAVLDAERARTQQVPPVFSAISVGGARSHRLARRGEASELPPRPVAVQRLTVIERGPSTLVVDVEVSKGYYVRSLARDIGDGLGVPSHLAALERRASGPYRLEEAITWPPTGPCTLVPLAEAATRCLPTLRLTVEGVLLARQGKELRPEHFAAPPENPGISAWLTPEGALCAVGEPRETAAFRVRRGFNDAP